MRFAKCTLLYQTNQNTIHFAAKMQQCLCCKKNHNSLSVNMPIVLYRSEKKFCMKSQRQKLSQVWIKGVTWRIVCSHFEKEKPLPPTQSPIHSQGKPETYDCKLFIKQSFQLAFINSFQTSVKDKKSDKKLTDTGNMTNAKAVSRSEIVRPTSFIHIAESKKYEKWIKSSDIWSCSKMGQVWKSKDMPVKGTGQGPVHRTQNFRLRNIEQLKTPNPSNTQNGQLNDLHGEKCTNEKRASWRKCKRQDSSLSLKIAKWSTMGKQMK